MKQKKFVINKLGLYKTRNGRIVKITSISKTKNIATGFTEDDGEVDTWQLDGSYCLTIEGNLDIVSIYNSEG